jgi:glutathione synthase/RimK-type ligase-like ATP-grasp enzyme
MKRMLYLVKRILKMDYMGLFNTVKAVHKKTGINSIRLFFDIIKCGIKYGAGYKDYQLCQWYNLNDAQRATYVTRGINNRIVSLLNDKEYYHILDNKIEFNNTFSQFLNRKWIDMTTANFEEFCHFLNGLDVIISKPTAEACGKGVEKLTVADFPSAQVLFAHLKDINSGLCEEFVVQHKDISALYPLSVNTYRIVTVLTQGQPHIVYAFIRIGNGGRFVDNINAGGMAAPINIETGVIEYPAFDKDSIYYEIHPFTGCPIKGWQLPCWQEAVELVLAAAKVIPQVGYVGWDVAVTENGPLLIEGNPFPGHDILQMPPHVPDKIGMLPNFKKYIKNL